jgi:hypothetical protein
VFNIQHTPGGLMRGVRRKANRIATGMTRALCSENSVMDIFLQAACEAGYPICEDFNGRDQEGRGRWVRGQPPVDGHDNGWVRRLQFSACVPSLRGPFLKKRRGNQPVLN